MSNVCAITLTTIPRTEKCMNVVLVYLQQILKIKVKQCKRQAHRLHVLLLLLHYVHAADNHNLTDTHINTHFEMWANIYGIINDKSSSNTRRTVSFKMREL